MIIGEETQGSSSRYRLWRRLRLLWPVWRGGCCSGWPARARSFDKLPGQSRANKKNKYTGNRQHLEEAMDEHLDSSFLETALAKMQHEGQTDNFVKEMKAAMVSASSVLTFFKTPRKFLVICFKIC